MDRAIGFDEDALTRADLGGFDHCVHVSIRHPRQTSRAPRVIQYPAGLSDVGDPVLELHEHVGAMIEAQTVAGAEVLVNPHAHVAGQPSAYSADRV